MTTYDVKRLALILAVQAEIEGMKAYNASYPDSIGYGQKQFDDMANQLRELATKHDEQL